MTTLSDIIPPSALLNVDNTKTVTNKIINTASNTLVIAGGNITTGTVGTARLATGTAGAGGSSGSDGQANTSGPRAGGDFGGGGGGSASIFYGTGRDGSGGAVRIIWGAGRAYPSTDTENV